MKKAMANGADILVQGLVGWGVRHLFGMPGSHSTTIYDALARSGSIRTILTRNEHAGAFAADGSARVTGKPGVICTTAGPGATNALDRGRRVLGRLGADPPARRPGQFGCARPRMRQLSRDRPRRDLPARDGLVRNGPASRSDPLASGPGLSSDDPGAAPPRRPLSPPGSDASALRGLGRADVVPSPVDPSRTRGRDRRGRGSPGRVPAARSSWPAVVRSGPVRLRRSRIWRGGSTHRSSPPSTVRA